MQKTTTSLILIEDLGLLFPTETSKTRKSYGLYLCSCGTTFKVIKSAVKSGNTKSCGCYQKKRASEANITHGLKTHPLYRTWTSIIRRCENKNTSDYKNYGELGVSVDPVWRNSFQTFYEDMLSTWEEGLTIDRKDHLGNYSKDNCRWVTKNTQARNTRRIMSTNTSNYRGVYFDKNKKKWISAIGMNNKKVYLGAFDTALEGAIAYDTYVVENNLEHTINGVLL